MRIVCILGIDGSGKSTLARKLVAWLNDHGIAARYLYGRIVPTFSLLLMNLGRSLFLKHGDPWKNFDRYSANKRQVMRAPFVRGVYVISIFIDFYVQIWWKLLPHMLSERILVVDRYIFDTVVNDIAAHLEFSEAKTLRLVQAGLRFLPNPDLAILLDVEEEIAYSRKSDVPHINYLRERRHYYLTFRDLPRVFLVNGEMPQQVVLDESLLLLERTLDLKLTQQG